MRFPLTDFDVLHSPSPMASVAPRAAASHHWEEPQLLQVGQMSLLWLKKLPQMFNYCLTGQKIVEGKTTFLLRLMVKSFAQSLNSEQDPQPNAKNESQLNKTIHT